MQGPGLSNPNYVLLQVGNPVHLEAINLQDNIEKTMKAMWYGLQRFADATMEGRANHKIADPRVYAANLRALIDVGHFDKPDENRLMALEDGFSKFLPMEAELNKMRRRMLDIRDELLSKAGMAQREAVAAQVAAEERQRVIARVKAEAELEAAKELKDELKAQMKATAKAAMGMEPPASISAPEPRPINRVKKAKANAAPV